MSVSPCPTAFLRLKGGGHVGLFLCIQPVRPRLFRDQVIYDSGWVSLEHLLLSRYPLIMLPFVASSGCAQPAGSS